MTYDKTKYFEVTDDGKKTTSELLNECRNLFSVWSYCDDKKLDEDFPKPKEATTRYFKRNIEADEENANKSANDLEGLPGITLRERIIMELQYFKETGEHLDIYNWTLCTGSCYSDGSVPCVGWGVGNRELCVDWCDADGRRDSLRSRSAVSPSDFNTTVPLDLEEAIKVVKEAGYRVSKDK